MYKLDIKYKPELNFSMEEDFMTIIVGVKCNDGIVIGSDSQASVSKGVPIKRPEYAKIFDIKIDSNKCALLTGAGTVAYITRASEEMSKKCKDKLINNPREFADACEDVVNFIFKRYVVDKANKLGINSSKNLKKSKSKIKWQGDIFSPPSFILFSGIMIKKNNKTELGLYTIHPDGVAENIGDYDAIGSGAAIAEYILSRLWHKNLKIGEAIKLVIYVIEEVKKIDPYCGGLTRISLLDKDGAKTFDDAYIMTEANKILRIDKDLTDFWSQLVFKPEKINLSKKENKGKKS